MFSHQATSFTPAYPADGGIYFMAHMGHELATVLSHKYLFL
jgi:hypothetical protein